MTHALGNAWVIRDALLFLSLLASLKICPVEVFHRDRKALSSKYAGCVTRRRGVMARDTMLASPGALVSRETAAGRFRRRTILFP